MGHANQSEHDNTHPPTHSLSFPLAITQASNMNTRATAIKTLSPRLAAAALAQSTRQRAVQGAAITDSNLLKLFINNRCAHCRENPRVTYNDDDDDHTGFLDDTTLCSNYPNQCWFKTHNLLINRFECAFSRKATPSEPMTHGYSCPCIIPGKYRDTKLDDHIQDYLQFSQYVVQTENVPQ
jgi:hypothetical protein